VIDWAAMKEWGGWVLGGAGFFGAIWNWLGIKHLDLRTDGLQVKWMAAEKGQSHAEGKLDEQSDVRHRERNKQEAENNL
jgi:hypothetical protein